MKPLSLIVHKTGFLFASVTILALIRTRPVGANGCSLLDHYAEHSVPAPHFVAHLDEWTRKGYLLNLLTGFQDTEGIVRYNTIWEKNTDNVRWKAFHGLTEKQFESNLAQHRKKGFVLKFVDGYSVARKGKTISRINVIYTKEADNPAKWNALYGLTRFQYKQHLIKQTRKGFNLDIVSTYQQNGSERLASLFSRHPPSDKREWVSHYGMTNEGFQEKFNNLVRDQGYSLEYMSAGTITDDEPRFAALFVKDSATTLPSRYALIDVSDADVRDQVHQWLAEGYTPKVIDAYQDASGNLLWALLFSQEGEEFTRPPPNGDTFPETACFDNLVSDLLQAHDVPGASVAVKKNNTIVYAQGYGSRDVPGIGNQVCFFLFTAPLNGLNNASPSFHRLTALFLLLRRYYGRYVPTLRSASQAYLSS